MMVKWSAIVVMLLVSITVSQIQSATLELYGNYHTMGVIVDLTGAEDPDEDAAASIQYREAGSGQLWSQGHHLSRVDMTRFSGSIFWLSSGISYDVQVIFSDPDGLLHEVLLSSTAATRHEPIEQMPFATFYVTFDGTGTECSETNPCHFDEALAQAHPGDEIILQSGVYRMGNVTFPRSGTATDPIVIRGADSADVWLDGSDPTPFSWTHAGNGVYQTILNSPDTHLVIVDNERIYPYQSYSDMENLIWGLSGFYCNGTSLAVKLLDQSSPAAHSTIISRHNQAFYVNGRDYLSFKGLGFRYYGCASYAKAIYLNNASNTVIDGCDFQMNDLGIGIKRDSHQTTVQNCQFNDSIFDWPWDAVKAGAQLETGGIRFYSPCTGRGTVIRYNHFEDYFDGFGVCPGSTSGETNETDVYGNTARDIGDDCIETDGQCANIRIWNNRFSNCLVGISLAPVYTGPVYAVRNLIVGTGAGNNSYPGSPFKFNSGYDQSGPMFLYHNTSLAENPGCHGLDIKAPGTWTLITARNNIWRGTEYGMRNYNTTNPVDLDYNNISNSGSSTLVYWDDTHYAELAVFAASTGQELNGFDIEPVFVDPAEGDYRLAVGSPLIDAGILIPGINQDFINLGPDVGAFEMGDCPNDGDTNQDGDVTASDAQLAFLIALGVYTPTYLEACSADCTADGSVTASDAQRIFLVVLGQIAEC